MENDNITVEPFQLLSSNSFFQSIQEVTAASISHLWGMNLGLSKSLLLQEQSIGYT
jgi:hypothetical protein